MNKFSFLKELSHQLEEIGIPDNDRREILDDFERHFSEGEENGLTEAEICGNLGDIREIALQYAAETVSVAPRKPRQEKALIHKLNIGGLVGIIFMDLFVFSWLVPTVAALVISYFAVAVSLVLSGAVVGFASIFAHSLLYTSLSFISVFFLGGAVLTLGGIAMILGVFVARGFVGFIKWFVNLHAKWTFGTVVFSDKNNRGVKTAKGGVA